jgi:hypothetical protein
MIKLHWQKYDYPRGRPMSVVEQLKYNFSIPYWKFLRRLCIWGFLTTREGYIMRLRDFTPFFWKTLVAREHEKMERKIDLHAIRMQAVTEFVDRILEK